MIVPHPQSVELRFLANATAADARTLARTGRYRIGEPRAIAGKTGRELHAAGLVGVYGQLAGDAGIPLGENPRGVGIPASRVPGDRGQGAQLFAQNLDNGVQNGRRQAGEVCDG